MPRFVGTGFPIEHNMAWAEAYLRTKWHLDPSSPLVTLNMGRQVGGALYTILGAWADVYIHLHRSNRLATTDYIVTESRAVST